MPERDLPDRPRVDLPTRYRIVEEIGSGRTATVWRARDTRTGRDVAVKVLRSADRTTTPGDDDLMIRRLEREVRSLGRLTGTVGVCRMLEVGVDRSRIPWIVSEFMPGGALATSKRSVTVEDCRTLFGALAIAHGHDIVHGDVSPANILFDGDGRPVLADFGMAALGLEGTGRDIGGMTPAYAAPERLRGGRATAASDVHALAASLIEHLPVSDSRTGDSLRRALVIDPRRRPTAGRLAKRLR